MTMTAGWCTKRSEAMVRKIFNASNMLGTVAFLAMIAATGTVEERPGLTVVLTAAFAGCAYLSIREDGKNK